MIVSGTVNDVELHEALQDTFNGWHCSLQNLVIEYVHVFMCAYLYLSVNARMTVCPCKRVFESALDVLFVGILSRIENFLDSWCICTSLTVFQICGLWRCKWTSTQAIV